MNNNNNNNSYCSRIYSFFCSFFNNAESYEKVKEAIRKSSDIQEYVHGTEPVTIQTLQNILKDETIDQYFFNNNVFKKDKICEPLDKIKEYCGYNDNGEERVNSFLKPVDVISIISGPILSRAFSNFYDGESKKAKLYFNTFVKRLNFIAGYLDTDLADIIKECGDKYYVESSGSDLHQNGNHVLYLINKKTGKREKVYKPHDLKIDKAIIGQNICVNDLDYEKMRKAKKKTINNYHRRIYQKYSSTDKEYTEKKQEEYSEKLKSEKDQKKKKEYKKKSEKNYRSPSASILEKLNKKLINESRDLYKRENNGEDKYGSDKYDYNEYGIPFLTMKIEDDHLEEYIQDLKEKSVPENKYEQKKYFYKLGMLDVISQAMAISDLHHENLVRDGSNPRIIDAEFGFLQYGRMYNGVRGMLNAIKNKEKLFYNNEDNYNSYHAGFKFMCKKIKEPNMVKSLVKKVGKLLGKVEKIRMFPKDTEFLQGQLGTFLNGNEETKNAVLKDLKKFIEDKIKNSEFGFVLSNEKITIKNNLETKLKEALNNGTIVYMSLNIKNGTVCIDDEPIADIEINNQKGEDIKKEMIKCIKKHITKRMENIDKNISIISCKRQYEKYNKGGD